MEKDKLSIIIPVYNEVNTVLEVIRRVQTERHNKEIIIVDDGSSDGSADLLRQIKEENIKVIFLKQNRGKGYALREAIKHISGDMAIIQDADLEYYADEYTILIDKIIQNKADVVYGTRFLGSHRVFNFYHFLGNNVLNLIANILLNTTLTDLMSGFKAFKTAILKQLVLEADGFGIEAEITAEIFKRRLRVYEVPISYEGRDYEEGKKIKWTDFFSCLYWLIRALLRKIDVAEETLLKMRMLPNYNLWTYHKMKPFLGKEILEIGAGIGRISKYLVSLRSKVTLSDINDDHLDYLRERFIGNPLVKIIKMDGVNFNSRTIENKFDTIVAVNVLEHIENDVEALKKINDGLIKEGKLLLIVPAHKILFGKLDTSLGHYRRYSRKELTDKLIHTGFIIEKMEYMNFLSAIAWLISFRLLNRKRMFTLTIFLADKLIPLVKVIEKFIKFPFGLSLFAVAKRIS